MRLFLAIDTPGFPALNYDGLVNVGAHHITVKFFGEVDEYEFKEICQRLDRFSFSPFQLKTGTSLDCFSNWDNCKVVYVPVESNELRKLNEKLTSLFADKFAPMDFVGHITLARAKKELDPSVTSKLKQTMVEQKQFRVTELKLIQSVLTSTGVKFFERKKIRL